MTADPRLASSCTILQILLETAAGVAAGDDVVRDRRERAALAAFDAFPAAAAMLAAGRNTVALANGAWLTLLGDVSLPQQVKDHVSIVIASNTTAELPRVEVETPYGARYLAVSLAPLLGNPGVPDAVLAVCAEITDDVIAARLGVPVTTPIWGCDASGAHCYFNAASRALSGTVRNWQEAIHGDDRERCRHACDDMWRRRVPAEVDARMRTSTGEYRWHHITFRPSDTAVWHAIAVDIHETRIEAERASMLAAMRIARADAERANQLKDEFLAALSHELRAPLTTMLLWEKVLREETGDAARAHALDAIHQSAMAQSRLVGDLLDVSRAISGKLFVDIRPLHVSELLETTLAHARPAAAAKQIELHTEQTKPVGELNGDALRLQQVLDNLLSNALHATPAGGTVTLHAKRTAHTIEISVIDTGRGIAPELLERIFEPFVQSDEALAQREGGLGLGLAISRKLAELHGGTLTAHSAGKGQGAKLTLTLPASSSRSAPSPPAGATRSKPLQAIRLLVIDDDVRVRDALAILLSRAGAVVETSPSAASARTQIAAAMPELVICDIAMPDEDGYSFVRWLRERDAKVPAIALTALATETDAQRALAAGFNVHLAKPISIERLVACVSELHLANVEQR